MGMCSQLRLGLGMSNAGVLGNGLILKRKSIKCGSYQDITGSQDSLNILGDAMALSGELSVEDRNSRAVGMDLYIKRMD
jgi:hypothetical protein